MTLIDHNHAGSDIHCSRVDQRPNDSALPDHHDSDTHNGTVGQRGNTWADADALLLVAADVLDDIESARKSAANRHQALTSDFVEGERGGSYGKGLPADSPEAMAVASLVDGLAAIEHQAELDLKRAVRGHPLGPWMRATIGVGEKQGARLLAAIGDPAWHSRDDRPRRLSELYAFCGFHVLPAGQLASDTQGAPAGGDPSRHPDHLHNDTQFSFVGVAPARRRGRKSNWSGSARSRAWLIATSCIKQTASPYRSVYDAGRVKYAETTHRIACAQCGTPGHPAAVGSPLRPGHQHARALRLVAKAVLRDLWIEARRLRETAPEQ